MWCGPASGRRTPKSCLMAEGNPSATDGPRGWRDPSTSKADLISEHRWQSSSPTVALGYRRGANYWLCLAGLIALGSWLFLSELLFSRPRTPMLVVAPSNYEQPFQPLSWSHEDLARLRELDGETLNIPAVESSWKSRDQGLRQLDSKLQDILRQSHRPETVVLYLRMHSAVDGSGVPCLVPPGASPFDSDTWLPLKDVLDRFRKQRVPDSMHKLVILDCSSVLVNWNQGILFNTFADRLPEAVSAAAIPNLVVLNAAGPSEVSATSADLRRGVFGHFLGLGLKGAADAPSESGNGDLSVSVRELHRYLSRHVNDWSRWSRGRFQRPQLVPAEPPDFKIAGVFNPLVSSPLESDPRHAASPLATVSADEIAPLWLKLEEFQDLDPIRFDPSVWTDMEQRLLWLEMASESGADYGIAARRVYTELQQWMATVEKRGQGIRYPRSLHARWGRFTTNSLPNIASLAQMHTVPLAEYFGTIDPVSADLIRAALMQFKKSPSSANLHDALQSLSATPELSELEQCNLLRLWQTHDVVRLWHGSEFLSSVIELHELAEQVSVPDDERVLDWVRPLVDAADAVRRKIDDQVFLGGPPPANEIAEATRLYGNARDVATDVSHAFQVRDQVSYELPFLAQWLTRQPLKGNTPSWPLTDALELLPDLTRNVLSLEHALSRPGTPVGETDIAVPFQGLLREVESQRERLLGQLAAEYERLLQTREFDSRTWDEMHGLLSIPLLPNRSVRLALGPAQQRIELRKKLSQLGATLLDGFRNATTANDPPRTSGSEQMPGYLEELLARNTEHLALAIVRRESDETAVKINAQAEGGIRDVVTIAETQGALLRELLQAVPAIVLKDTEQQLTSMDHLANRRATGECAVRASASIGDPGVKDDPIGWQRRTELQRLLLWHAERALDDFWGGTVSEEKLFFEAAASNALRTAEKIARPTSSLVQSELNTLRTLLKRRLAAAKRGFVTTPEFLQITNEETPVVAKVAVYASASDEALFPEGRGAVFVRGTEGESLGEIEPMTIPIIVEADAGAPAAKYNIRVKDAARGNRTLELKAVTLFRGHEYLGDITLNASAGVIVNYIPEGLPQSRITVRGRRLRKLSVLFVLDCSKSMGEELPSETAGQTGSRLQIAKLALQSMLSKLAEDDVNRVGVICFGHRVGWDLKRPGMLLQQQEYNALIPDHTRPYDDVETILPLGRFNASFANAVSGRLSSVRPWGESPLHLALIQALRQFENEDDDTDKAVVVITDGLNYQFNPPAASRKSVADVLGAENNRRVPVHIVGLGIAADQADAAQREFGALARLTGGSYVSAQEARTLAESLVVLQRLREYRVRNADGEVQVAELSRPIVVSTPADRQNEFVVSLGSAFETVSLRGGESVELVPSRDGLRLEVLGDEVGQPQFVPLLKADRETDLVAGFRRPQRWGTRAAFEVSIQHRQRQFVPRPNEVWVEITPIFRVGQATPPTYVFYDANYLPHTTVPVLRWTVKNWPADALQARIRIWFKQETSKSVAVVALSEAMKHVRNPDVALEGVPGVSYRVNVQEGDSLQIHLTERHSADSLGLDAVKVDLETSVTPSRILYRLDAVNRVATQYFQFSERIDEVLQTGKIRFTTRTSAQAGAWRSVDAVVVDVTESSDVHEPKETR